MKRKKEKQKVLLFGIRNKICVCFLVPIIFMIVLGIVSYKKAETGMNEKFCSSTQQTINMALQYIDMNSQYIEAEALKYVVDAELNKYFLGLYEDDAAKRTATRDSERTGIMASQVGNKFIENIYLIPSADGEVYMITANMKDYKGNYDEYMQEMKALSEDGKTIPTWVDHHDALDEYLKIDQSSYILSCQRESKQSKSLVVVDVKTEAIKEFIDTLDLGEGSIVGFVTENGRELISEKVPEGETGVIKEGEPVFADKEFYLQASDEEVKEVEFAGRNYLFLHKRSNEINASVCALVPMEIVSGQAEEIKQITGAFVFLAAILALIIGIWITTGIRKNMKRILKSLKEMAKGNLTTRVEVKGKDEFRGLAEAANDMIANNKKLVIKVSQATGTLGESADEVTNASGVINDYSENISQAIGEINTGMEKQSLHAQECVAKTDKLSAEIQEVNRIARNVEELVQNAEDMINRGMQYVDLLEERANETTRVTAQVGESIETLKKESEIINEFVATITEISEETNLLSLNASIEAARAGEAGKGFAVVAEEIRKLADSSAQAAGEIGINVQNISAQTIESVESAKQAGRMVELQTEAVKEVTAVFQGMNQSMEELFVALKEILVSTEKADKEREDTLDAVINISQIIEETAASAEVVANIAENLQQNVENLNQTAEGLGENMTGLVSEIAVFKTE
ncbi:MAG: methyl-accepting chemotaxis protein [Lachnospiraceae bacterium]